MNWIAALILTFIIDCFIGFIIYCVIDECSGMIFDAKEITAIIVFWPILGTVVGVMGFIALIAKVYKSLQEDLEAEE